MNRHVFLPAVISLSLLAAGLSTGKAVFLAPGLLMLLLMLLSAAAVRWTAGTLKASAKLESSSVQRGGQVRMIIRVTHRCPLPAAPMTAMCRCGPGEPDVSMELESRSQQLSVLIHAAHVGVCHPGVSAVEISDLFGFFTQTVKLDHAQESLTVLPVPHEVAPLTLLPADQGLGTMARASEDQTDPVDVRKWQAGDPMKKVHWKLSASRQEMLVRRFEEPVQPEVLVLLDCSAPPEMLDAADARDMLTETAVSILVGEDAREHEVCLPVWDGAMAMEITGKMGMPAMAERLAQLTFTAAEPFDYVLRLETQRLRQVGAVAVITANLSGALEDVLLQMRRLGPSLRLFLMTASPEETDRHPSVVRLRRGGVEVEVSVPVLPA